MSSKSSGLFRFRKHDRIGAAAAEEDIAFLSQCFVDTGDLAILTDCSDARRIVVGRTGAGKSALLQQLERKEKNVIKISPENLTLNHIANSGTIRFCSEAGINLDIFYKMLWRHVFTVEVLKQRYEIVNEQSKTTFMERLFGGCGVKERDTRKHLAMEYLEKFSDKFWQDTEYRIGEIRQKVENDLQAAIKGNFPHVAFEAGGAKKLSEEQLVEVVHRGQEIVQNLQVRQLNDVLDILRDDLLGDMQRKYFIVIDRLDENWVDDSIRFQLIRALIDTAREFRRVPQVKIIVFIRTDLLETVFEYTRDSGFQEEKYRSVCFPIVWSKANLAKVLELRINKLIRDAYTSSQVLIEDVLPKASDGKPAFEYMIERTLQRPRDLIEFFNVCLQRAEESAVITRTMLFEAEHEYSKSRLLAVGDEWTVDYPGLVNMASKLLSTRNHAFRLGDIDPESVTKACYDFCIQGKILKGKVHDIAQQCAEERITTGEFARAFTSILYKTGVIGIKAEGFQKVSWAETSVFSVNPPDIHSEVRIHIHPTFWRALGIVPPPGQKI